MMNKNNNYIWLFGENLGETANNNSFYFWKHIVSRNKERINKYFILTKNKKNKKIYNSLSKEEKKAIVWKNSIKHHILYKNSDMNFVTLSYRDTLPEKMFGISFDKIPERPIVYLQHGTIAIKEIGYTGSSFYNNMFKFIYYNESIKEQLVEINDFRRYQLYYGEFHPRYKELVKRAEDSKPKKQILWFLTWREYIGENVETEVLVRKIRSTLANKRLQDYLKQNNLKIKVCIHQLFDEILSEKVKKIDLENVEIKKQTEIDIMQEIVDSEVLITDYSSLGFDFTLLNKPVILFAPDMEEYLQERNLYCDIEELNKYSITKITDLINTIVNKKYTLNEFFRKRMPKEIDFEYIKNGMHIEKMYTYFKRLQKRKVVFLGYNFYGAGGTVYATRSLAEGLLEKGYPVELLSLKKVQKIKNPPYGLQLRYLYDSNEKDIINRLKRSFIFPKKCFKYLKYDPSVKYLVPYAGYKLQKILKKMRAKTVISTREDLHLFLNDASSKEIKNKIYFFHTSANLVETLFPTVMDKIKKIKIQKAVFVSEKNRQELIKKYNFNQYKEYLISGNALERSNCRNINKIEKVEKKQIYNLIYLLRISKERKKDLENLISFGEYLKENEINNITIDVFGTGDYVDEFLDKLEEKELFDIIIYKGKTNNPTHQIRYHDAVVDFSLNQSFGMTYLEGILNGKKVFCMKNAGSLEVMKDIPNSFIESNEDLVEKIRNLSNITVEELQENYRKIEERYSRRALAEKFINFLN